MFKTLLKIMINLFTLTCKENVLLSTWFYLNSSFFLKMGQKTCFKCFLFFLCHEYKSVNHHTLLWPNKGVLYRVLMAVGSVTYWSWHTHTISLSALTLLFLSVKHSVHIKALPVKQDPSLSHPCFWTFTWCRSSGRKLRNLC